MVDVGSQDNWVDTQKFRLTNTTDSLTYIQLTDVTLDLDSNVVKHQLSDDTIDNVFSLYMSSVQGNMWITNPEWTALVLLTVDVDGVRPVNDAVTPNALPPCSPVGFFFEYLARI